MKGMLEITSAGYGWAVWNGSELIGVYDRYTDALDVATGWDRQLWPWRSLWDHEHREDAQKARQEKGSSW